MLDRGDKDAITLLFAAVLNKGSMKVEQKRKKIKKAGLSGKAPRRTHTNVE
jgi:hypothetical protein